MLSNILIASFPASGKKSSVFYVMWAMRESRVNELIFLLLFPSFYRFIFPLLTCVRIVGSRELSRVCARNKKKKREIALLNIPFFPSRALVFWTQKLTVADFC